MSTNYSSANYGVGILFPGETWDPHPQCHDCDSYGGPHYAVTDGAMAGAGGTGRHGAVSPAS